MAMRSFDDILSIAVARKGTLDAVLSDAPKPLTEDQLAAIPSRDWLEQMAKCIFQAGISWKVVENKWPGITEAFSGFDVGRISMMDDDWFDRLLCDPRVIRSGPKIAAVRDNAIFIRHEDGQGGFSSRVARWPTEDYAGLLDWLSRNGSRLGGTSGQYVLRFMGKEGFILSKDVVARLVEEGVINGPPSSKKAMAAVQSAFNRWKAESGLDLTAISRVLARSIG